MENEKSFEGLVKLSQSMMNGELTPEEYIDHFVLALAEMAKAKDGPKINADQLAAQMTK